LSESETAPARPEPAPAPDEAPPALPDGSPVERLDQVIARLERTARKAESDGDPARVVMALRAVSDVTKTIAALTPPKPVAQDDRPQIIQARQACEKAWLDLVERVAAEEAGQ
jgi:hypothetical protein